MGAAAWIKAFVAGGGIVGLGVTCFIYTTPTDEELLAVCILLIQGSFLL